jgi:hypothetical protein
LRVMTIPVHSLLLPDLHMVRFTTFGQDPVLVVPYRD